MPSFLIYRTWELTSWLSHLSGEWKKSPGLQARPGFSWEVAQTLGEVGDLLTELPLVAFGG